MIIQSSVGVPAYNASSKITLPQQGTLSAKRSSNGRAQIVRKRVDFARSRTL